MSEKPRTIFITVPMSPVAVDLGNCEGTSYIELEPVLDLLERICDPGIDVRRLVEAEALLHEHGRLK